MESGQGRFWTKKTPDKILILRAGALGDTILTMPAIWALRRRWPTARLSILCRPDIHVIIRRMGVADEALSIDGRLVARLCSPHAELDAADRAFLSSFDLIVSYLHDADGMVAMNCRRASNAQVVAISPLPGPQNYQDTMVDRLQLSGAGTVAELAMELTERLRLSCHVNTVDQDGPYVVIHPGSGGRAKNWPLEKFVEMAKHLSRERGMPTRWLLGEAEGEIVGDLVAAGVDHASMLINRPLDELAAWLVHATAYVGNDSGISHLAALCGTRGTVLFGPSEARVWAPRGSRIMLVMAEEATASSLMQISVDRVLLSMTGSTSLTQ